MMVRTHAKELNVVQDLVIEGKVIAGNYVDASIFLDLPMLETKAFAFRQQAIARQLAGPVGFGGLFQVPKDSHAWEAQN
jgi:hypothetical protein